MSNFFQNIYRKLVLRLYLAGKAEADKLNEQLLLGKVSAASGVRFYPGAEVINLSGTPGAINVGENTHVSGLMMVYPSSGSIFIGAHCSLSPFSRLISAKNITIGNRVLIAHNVNIIDNISHPIDAEQRHQDFMASYKGVTGTYDIKGSEIIIGDDVWIGFNSTVLRGITIGNGAIIGSNTVVTKNIEPWTVNVGNPARCIRSISPEATTT